MTLEGVAEIVELEGFDYAFTCYSTFEEVEDPEFHRLRTDYVRAAKALRDYLPDPEDDDTEESEEDEDDGA